MAKSKLGKEVSDLLSRFSSEELFLFIANEIPAAIAITDIVGNMVFVNETFEQLTGYVESGLTGEKIEKFVPVDAKALEEFLDEHSVNPTVRSPLAKESSLLKKDGKKIPVSIMLSVLRFNGTKLIMALIQDITEIKSTKAKLKESIDAFMKFSQAKQNLEDLLNGRDQ